MNDRDRTRREFLGQLTLAGAGGLLGLSPGPAGAEPPPETTRLRLLQAPSLCWAPLHLAEELLAAEGFTDVQYLKREMTTGYLKALGTGEAQFSMGFIGPMIIEVDAGEPIVTLAGVHVGCFELFGNDRVRSIRDLKGKTVAIPAWWTSPHVFIASMAAYVGLDPRKDINWVIHPRPEAIRLFAEGKVDALIGFPPDPQELREKKIGHVVVNSSVDRPWSQYFCCMATGSREWVRKHPVATKRALRAILKTTDVCALEPERVARSLVDRGLQKRYDYSLEALKGIPFARWREYDPEDAVRFYALRLHEAGMIQSTPQKIIAQGTDWRFLNELKKELKG